MKSDEVDAALENFATELAESGKGDAPFIALQNLTRRLVGAQLFTTLTVDMKNDVYRREYSSDPATYPKSGTKPIDYNRWFETVCVRRELFVANTIVEIASLFRDHALIASLGFGSVINIPVVLDGELVGSVNCTDVEGYYTPEKLALLKHLAIPAKLAFALAMRPGAPSQDHVTAQSLT